MASASTIPPLHVDTATMQGDDADAEIHWPSLNADKDGESNDWELIPPEPLKTAQVTFCPTSFVEKTDSSNMNPKMLKHAQSSPNLRGYVLTNDEDSTEESAVLVEDTASMASSSVVMVPGVSAWSQGSSRIRNAASPAPVTTNNEKLQREPTKPNSRKFKTRFVVKKPEMRRCSKSMPDLHGLVAWDEGDEDVLGDTDAHEYYSRKAQGAIGRMNGTKKRPDEAKRLQMTMEKKHMQRQRQMATR